MVRRRAKRRTGGDSYEDVKYQINVREGNRLAPVLRDLIGTEDPEDLAGGGIAGMLGERMGYDNGKIVKRKNEEMGPLIDTNDWCKF